MDQPPYLIGQFLLAMPGIGDPRFERSVIAMCSHDDRGALGIGLGRTLPGLGLHALLGQLEIATGVAADVPIHVGGPVERQRGFVLHGLDWGGEGTVQVAGRWAMSGALDVLRAIAAGRGPARYVVALGYAGWDAGQLDGEMTRHGWLPVAGDLDLLYDTPAEARWSAAFAGEGIDARLLGSASGQA